MSWTSTQINPFLAPLNINMRLYKWYKVPIWVSNWIVLALIEETDGSRHLSLHSSLLRTFGLSATSTYDSYLPLLFGKFALIWGHFQNVSVCRFRGRWGRWGQTTSKSKTTKILNENLLKLDEIQYLASLTTKMRRLIDFENGLKSMQIFQRLMGGMNRR